MTDDPSAVASIAAATPPHILSLLVPILSILMGIGVVMLGLWLDYRKKREFFQLHHAERMAAIEKSVELPPLPPEFFQGNRPQTPSAHLRRGLMGVLIGAAVTAALYFQSDSRQQAWWGLVIVAYGVASLLFYALDGRRGSTDSAARDTPQPGDEKSNIHP